VGEHRKSGAWTLRAAGFAMAGLLAACAGPGPGPHGTDDRLARVDRIVAKRCADQVAAALGLEVATLADFAPDARERARRLGLGAALQVVALHADSAAHSAGLRVGDVIESIDGVAVADGAGARDRFVAAGVADGGDRVLRVRRGGESLEVVLSPRRPCVRSA
jgi:membrane-associated protease RseP (regulator of RpoE activity)